VEGTTSPGLTLEVSERRDVSVTATDASGAVVTGTALTATTSDEAIAGVTPVIGSGGGPSASAAFSLVGRAPGSATVRFRHSASGTTLDLPLTVEVPRPPVIGLSTTSVTLPATAGGVSPPPANVLVRNEGGGALSWSVRESAPWLAVSPLTGFGGRHFVLTANVAGLEEGIYEADVVVAASGAEPRTVQVTLVLASADLDFAGSYVAEVVVQAGTCTPRSAFPTPPVGRRRTVELAVTGSVPRIVIVIDSLVMGGTILADGSFQVRSASIPGPPVGQLSTSLTGSLRVNGSAAHLEGVLRHPGFLSCPWSEAVSGNRTGS
jgi:hypothetical protein